MKRITQYLKAHLFELFLIIGLGAYAFWPKTPVVTQQPSASQAPATKSIRQLNDDEAMRRAKSYRNNLDFNGPVHWGECYATYKEMNNETTIYDIKCDVMSVEYNDGEHTILIYKDNGEYVAEVLIPTTSQRVDYYHCDGLIFQKCVPVYEISTDTISGGKLIGTDKDLAVQKALEITPFTVIVATLECEHGICSVR